MPAIALGQGSPEAIAILLLRFSWPHAVLAGIPLVSAVITQFISDTLSALVMMSIGGATAAELGVSALPLMLGVRCGIFWSALIASPTMPFPRRPPTASTYSQGDNAGRYPRRPLVKCIGRRQTPQIRSDLLFTSQPLARSFRL
jgi:hypothetical protein